jgi:uncharacterized protein YjiS (DUF1127 family)
MRNDDLDYLILNYRRLTPSGRDLVKQLANQRARTLRTEFLRRFWQRIWSWNQRRIALAQLRALDDAALKDIGLHRSGIEAAVGNGTCSTEPEERQISPQPPKIQISPLPPKRQTFPEKPHLWLQRTG